MDADSLGQGNPSVWVLGSLISSFVVQYVHVPPGFSNKTPLCPSWLLLASLQHSAFPPGNTTIVSVLPGPNSLVPRLLPGRPTTRARDLLLFPYDPPPHYARLVSHLISRPSGSRTSPAGLGSRPNITDRLLLAADVTERRPASHCTHPPIFEVWFRTTSRGTATRGERR